jgi:predicted phage terminase large subunit-like protein
MERRRRLTEQQREEEQRLAQRPQLDERRALYEDSLYEFLKAAWPYIDPAPWQDGWCIEAIAEHLQAVVDGHIKRLLIHIPPRCCKSSLLAIAFPAWCWAQPDRSVTSGAGVKFMYASYAERLSRRDSLRCARLLTSPWYQSLWGDRFSLLQDSAIRLVNDVGGERLITSIPKGAATGEGGDLFICDDPNAANAAASEATIEATNEWWDQTASTRLNDPKQGAFIIQQQRLAEDDLSGHVLERNIGEWVHVMMPMRYEADRSFVTVLGYGEDGAPITWKDPRTVEGDLLWPERFGEREVALLEQTLGPWGSSGQLQQRPEPRGGGVIKRDWWNTWDLTTFPPFDYIIGSLDTAFTEKTENDFSALTIWGVFTVNTQEQATRQQQRSGAIDQVPGIDPVQVALSGTYAEETAKVMMMMAWQERLELHDLVVKVAETCKRNKVDMLLIENKASGHSVAQEMRRLYGHERFGVMVQDPKSMDKLARLHSVVPLFAPEKAKRLIGGKVQEVIVRQGIVWAPDRQWADMVITQVGMFPRGKHDDLVDTVSQALRFLRDTGMLQLSNERLAEVEEAKQLDNVKRPQPLYPG